MTHRGDRRPVSLLQAAAGAVLVLTVEACSGGGGGGGGGSTGSMGGGTSWTPGVYLPESHFAAQCAAPRSGTDPVTHRPFPDVAGTGGDEEKRARPWAQDPVLLDNRGPGPDTPQSHPPTHVPLAVYPPTAPPR